MESQITMTPAEAAEYLKVHLDTVRRLLRSGRLPGVKIGAQWRIHKNTLDEYLSVGGHGAKAQGR